MAAIGNSIAQENGFMVSMIPDINALLIEVKKAVSSGCFTLEDRWKNLHALSKYGYTLNDVKLAIGRLTYQDYCWGPELDRDTSRGGEFWLCGCSIGGVTWYIKLKLLSKADGNEVLCLSFHEAKYKLTFPYRGLSLKEGRSTYHKSTCHKGEFAMVNLVFCPNCGKEREYSVVRKVENYDVKGEGVGIETRVAICEVCGEEVFQEDLDSATIAAAYDEYRKRHNLLLPSEIREVREQYGLSQRAFSRLLNWGEITIHRYESGSIQDQSHNDLLVLLRDPQNMKTLLERESGKLRSKELSKFESRLKSLSGKTKDHFHAHLNDLLEAEDIDIYTGFRPVDLDRLANVVLYFAAKEEGLLKTKLMKLLWYSDFLNFKRHTVSLTGARYVHFPYGPVPERFNLLLGLMDGDVINIVPVEVYGYEGEQILPRQCFDQTLFSSEELGVLQLVYDQFKDSNASAISKHSHQERAYRETRDQETISYEWAKYLSL